MLELISPELLQYLYAGSMIELIFPNLLQYHPGSMLEVSPGSGDRDG